MRRASHDDILVLLRASEGDVALKKKLYSNMSENSIKIYVEDLVFQFRQGLPDYRLDEAMTRLLKQLRALPTMEPLVSRERDGAGLGCVRALLLFKRHICDCTMFLTIWFSHHGRAPTEPKIILPRVALWPRTLVGL